MTHVCIMRRAMAVTLVLFVMFRGGLPAFASDIDVEKQKLDMITDTASKICNTVSIDGSATSTEVKGQITAQLKGLASKLAEVGVSGTGTLNTESYHSVLQKDLVNALKESTDCKLKVFQDLQSRLLSSRDLNSVPPSAAQVLIGTWAGSYACGTSVGQLSWEIELNGSQLQVEESSSRRVGGISLPHHILYQATWNPPTLNLLAMTGIMRYNIVAHLSNDNRHIKGNYLGHGTCNVVSLVKES